MRQVLGAVFQHLQALHGGVVWVQPTLQFGTPRACTCLGSSGTAAAFAAAVYLLPVTGVAVPKVNPDGVLPTSGHTLIQCGWLGLWSGHALLYQC